MPALALVAAALFALADAAPLPISAHNCYPYNREDNARLKVAVALGIDNIEIDLGWDAKASTLIVGHDAVPQPGTRYPKFEEYVAPLIEARRPAGAAPTVLTIDWKTDRPEAVAAFKRFLDAHAELFSSAPKPAAPGGASPLTSRALTVCLTGSDVAKAVYDELVPAGGDYRAFRDRVFGAGAPFEADVAAYVPAPATPYHRFLTFHWGVVEKGGPAFAKDWTADDADRLAKLVALAHEKGYRIRIYCLNGHTGNILAGYRFSDGDPAARARWLAAAKAGVDWIASDEYAEIVEALLAAPVNPSSPARPRRAA